MRTRGNEGAYYMFLAIRRAVAASRGTVEHGDPSWRLKHTLTTDALFQTPPTATDQSERFMYRVLSEAAQDREAGADPMSAGCAR